MALPERARGAGRPAWTAEDPPERIVEFVEWYVNTRLTGTWTHAHIAEQFGVSMATINNWLKDERVLDLLDRSLRNSNAGPVRVQAVMDMLFRRATQLDDIKAAEKYLQAVDRLVPKARVDVVHHDATGLSDEELADRLRQALAVVARDQSEIIEAEVIEDSVGVA